MTSDDLRRMAFEEGFTIAFGRDGIRGLHCLRMPRRAGVYAVVRPWDLGPDFLPTNPAHPCATRSPEWLLSRWVADSDILYFGKAGGGNSDQNLARRITSLLKHGMGCADNHRGGQILWQVVDIERAALLWMAIDTPGLLECDLVQQFKLDHGGKRPFANLVDPPRRLGR